MRSSGFLFVSEATGFAAFGVAESIMLMSRMFLLDVLVESEQLTGSSNSFGMLFMVSIFSKKSCEDGG